MKRARSRSRRAAFLLIEVTIALGIVSFALVGIVGLLQVGLDGVRQSNEQALAAQNLNVLAACLQGARFSSGNATALSPFDDAATSALLSWNAGDAPQQGRTIPLDENGLPTANAGLASSLALVQITPGEGLSPTQAHIAIAWPAHGTTVKWNGANFTLTNQQGSLETVVYIHARPL